MVIHNLPGVLAFAYNIVVELVPKGKCCKSWAWEPAMGDRYKHHIAPYNSQPEPRNKARMRV